MNQLFATIYMPLCNWYVCILPVYQHQDTWVKVGQDHWPTFCGLIRKNFWRDSLSYPKKFLPTQVSFVIWQVFGPRIGIKIFSSMAVEALYIYQ